MVSDEIKTIQEYYNPPQIEFMRVNPRLARLKWGRGTGKTEGPIAFRIHNSVKNMPRSTGVFVVPSYQKFFTDLIPGIRLGLAKLKMFEGVHYSVGIAPPKSKNWDNPIYMPKNYNNVISFANGSILKLLSQDGSVHGQGSSIDYVIGDEAKLLDKARIDEEVLKGMRGNAHRFKNVPEYGSQLYCSDKFVKSKHFTWFFQEMDGFDPSVMEQFREILKYIDYLKATGQDSSEMEKQLQELAMVFPYISEASSRDNAYALGADFFKRVADSSTPMELLTSIFNEDSNAVEGGFYLLLDEYTHGYSSSNIDFLYGQEFGNQTLNCLKDADVNYNLPLDISFDFGGQRNFCTVSQYCKKSNTINLLKDFMEPKYEQLVEKLNQYYGPFKMKNKRINLYYDVMGNKSQANSYTTYGQDINNMLCKNGWHVSLGSVYNFYIDHPTKFNIWKKVLDESPTRDQRYPTFRYNKDNAFRAFVSMAKAEQKEVNGLITKDKKDEKNASKDQQYTTHFSDCTDYAVCTPLLPLYQGSDIIQLL